nr:hypothetical protein SYMBAF_100341 [Serratia symbiotica]
MPVPRWEQWENDYNQWVISMLLSLFPLVDTGGNRNIPYISTLFPLFPPFLTVKENKKQKSGF